MRPLSKWVWIPCSINQLASSCFERYPCSPSSRSGSSLQGLRTRTAAIHRSFSWADHFRWALCASSAPWNAKERSGSPRFDKATVVRCRGHGTKHSCGSMGCRGPPNLVYPKSSCERDPFCSRYFNTTFANWSFCVAVGARPADRTTLRNSAICSANETAVLNFCDGRTPTYPGVGVTQNVDTNSTHDDNL